ncbi:AAA-like domain-containing protein [Methanospirillum hungatei]|uniref:AAA-like domain-containing protein n=1 Tax=Methanospirillum hungatei TaxID=2203 RepID=UPI002BF4BB89|nr:AAA-like domain-containing protein [Methanospirillum hungatei]HOW04566.1 AAA-like domain-containing protein [Methanospirillum hungatei]
MMRFFNTAGPVHCEKHYCLPPLSRFNLPEILTLISQEKYFVLHAPRQSGKTSCMLALRDYLNREGRYSVLYINVEIAQTARSDVRRGMKAIISQLAYELDAVFSEHFLLENRASLLEENGEDAVLGVALSLLCKNHERPLILIIDEIDALVGDTLISVLRQIRAGYTKRPDYFPSSIILCGVRDVRDYRIHSDKDKSIITGGSAFNIKAKSLQLGNFTEDETRTLLLEHTKETGQLFEDEALASVWNLTRGQPWLVNALAYEVCFKIEEGKNRSNPITNPLVMEAKERLIQRRETHLDQLVDKLQEERVRRVIEPILTGEMFEQNLKSDDISYLVDLGLITQERGGALIIANPIYQEIIPRELSYTAQSGMSLKAAWYIDENGRIRVHDLLVSFQQFFREHSESWTEIAQYKEAAPQLLLQAFLQRIVNGGGQITREYGLGKGRTDLFILWRLPDGTYQRFVIECKIVYGSRKATISKGLDQVTRYADRCGAEEVYLLIFDRDTKKSWDEKIFTEMIEHQGRKVTIFGM